jgi:hypothetical protein
MATMSITKKEKEPADESPPLVKGQLRPVQERYLLQVDRQTKGSYADVAEAQKLGKAIKKAHPIVQVLIYDRQESADVPVE